MTGAGAGTRPETAAPVHYSPYDYEIHENPYPTYARLRAEAPLYRNDEFDFWALSRHADVLAAFRDPTHLSNRNGVSLDPAAYGPHAHKSMSFLAMDPPRHTRMRSLVSKAFTAPSSSPTSAPWRSATSTPPWAPAASTWWATWPASSPWTSSPR
jgi:cytochrome P450